MRITDEKFGFIFHIDFTEHPKNCSLRSKISLVLQKATKAGQSDHKAEPYIKCFSFTTRDNKLPQILEIHHNSRLDQGVNMFNIKPIISQICIFEHWQFEKR